MQPPSNRRPLLFAATHLAALALGLALFQSYAPPGKAASVAGAPHEGAVETSGDSPTAPPSSRPHVRQPAVAVKRSVYQTAWKSLAYEGLPRPERMKASAVILRDWIREDWRAALDTVMRETPDDFDLLDEFHDTFVRESGTVSRLIGEKRYGVLTKTLRDRWIGAISYQDEASIQRMAGSSQGPLKEAALEALRIKTSRTAGEARRQ